MSFVDLDKVFDIHNRIRKLNFEELIELKKLMEITAKKRTQQLYNKLLEKP